MSKLWTGMAAGLLLLSPPAFAQMAGDHAGHAAGNSMAGHEAGSDHKMKANAADKGVKERCNAMSHADAAKDAECAAWMKAHPEQMNHKPKPH